MFCWGLSKHGQAGSTSNDKVIVPQKIKIKKDYGKVLGISAAITDCNYLISFGCGKYGRLGCGDDKDNSNIVYTFVSTVTEEKLVKISCGLWHAAAITNQGSLYIWGHAKACCAPSNVLVPTCLGLQNVVGVSCGYNFTLAWTKEGLAYSWGSGHNGVLGHGDTTHQSGPKLIDAFKLYRIVEMSAGFCHSAAVTDDGNFFTWGKGKFGALGLGPDMKSDVFSPQSVPSMTDAKQASCSVGENHGHTLVVSKHGLVFAAGDGYKGKLGLGNQGSFSIFQQIPSKSFSDETIIEVSAGGIHSSAVSELGHVFTWGCGSDGRLGHPEAEGHRYLFRSDQPKVVELLREKHAMGISASYYHTVAHIDEVV